MKKYLILIFAISIFLSSCNLQAANSNIPNEPLEYAGEDSKKIEENYSKLHEFALMYEKYAQGYASDDYTPLLYTINLLTDLNKEDKFLYENDITIPYEDAKKISSLFMSYEISEDAYSGTHYYPLAEYPEISLEPFEINSSEEQVSILYGRFVNDEQGNKHWLYPVKYTAVPYILAEEDIPSILSDVFKAGEQMYRIINLENIYDIDATKNIYTNNGYGELFSEKSYDLASPEDLVAMSKRVNSRLYSEIRATYNLMCDIDMSGIEFEPIGKYTNYTQSYDHRVHDMSGFCGAFNGNNYTISNLSILKEIEVSYDIVENSNGFFSILGQGALVKDLNIFNANIDYIGEEGSMAAGILAGKIYGSKVENCKVSGLVKGTSNVGGLTGEVSSVYDVSDEVLKCEIINCHADVEVYGGNWIGGFTGSNNANIINCSVKGTLICDEIVNNKGHWTGEMPFGIGGFTGHNIKEISNSGANVWVKTMVNVKWVGSFIGYNDGHAYECFYNGTLSHWDPVGFDPNEYREPRKSYILNLLQEEYYTMLFEIK